MGRRFLRVPVPAADPSLFGEILEEQAADLPAGAREAIMGLYAAHYQSETTQLGPALFLGMCKYVRAASSAGALSVKSIVPRAGGCSAEWCTTTAMELYDSG